MSSLSLLEFQYKLSKTKFLKKPSRYLFSHERQNSPSIPAFHPNLGEMRKVFDKFDSNKDGKISKQEYKAILRALGHSDMIGEIPSIFQVADLDGDGYISFKEFVEVHERSGIKTRDIHTAFRTFDRDGDGKVSAEEVMEVLSRLGERCSVEDCRRMVKAVDTNGDGMVDINEFTTMMTQTLSSSSSTLH